MIQRIQSVLLGLALNCSALLFFIPVFHWLPLTGSGPLYSLSILKSIRLNEGSSQLLFTNWPLIMVNALIIIITLGTIFKYKDRMNQAKLCHLLLVLQLALGILLMYD